MAAFGITQIARRHVSTSFHGPAFEGSSKNVSSYALALYSGASLLFSGSGLCVDSISGLWAFEGWDQINYVAGEMKKPEKNIPRVIHFSMTVVIVGLHDSGRNIYFSRRSDVIYAS